MLYLILFIILSFETGDTNIDQNIPSSETVVIEFEDELNSYFRTISITYNIHNESTYLLENETGRLSKIDANGIISTLDTLTFEQADNFLFLETKANGEGLYFWERGLGEVYEYDLTDKTLSHISDTDVNKLMFYHGGIVDNQNRILAWGGYGFWESRNLLLEFDPAKKEWLLESNTFPSDVQLRSPHFLWYDSTANELNYLHAMEASWGDDFFYNFGTYDMSDKQWMNEWVFQISEDEYRLRLPLLTKSTYSADIARGLHFLTGEYFLNSKEHTVLKLSSFNKSESRVLGAFYSPADDEWVLICRDNENSTTNITIVRIPYDEMEFSEVAISSYYGRLLATYWWVPALFIGVLLTGFYYYFSTYSKEQQSSNKIKIKKTDEGFKVYQNGKAAIPSDDYLQKVWQLIYRLKKSGKNLIPIHEFDEEVFLQSHSDSFRSKRRSSLIKEINKMHLQKVISTQNNPIDKRFKDLHINLNLIEITDS